MARKLRKPSRKPRATITLYPDYHEGKRTPNGIRSVLLSIQYYWRNFQTGKPEDEHLTPKEFCLESGFEPIFRELFRRYPEMSGEVDDLAGLLQSLTSGDHNLEFVHLIAFAEFVQMPLSLFLLFSNLVSHELQSIDKKSDFRPVALSLLRKIRFVIEESEREIMSSRLNERLFVHVYDEFKDPHRVHLMAKAAQLRNWSETYNSSEAEKYAQEAVDELQRRDADRTS
jgi:hypothetical protein